MELQRPAGEALLRHLRPLFAEHCRAPVLLHEEAREAGWADDQILQAIAYGSIEALAAMVDVAGEVPVDGFVEAARTLRAVCPGSTPAALRSTVTMQTKVPASSEIYAVTSRCCPQYHEAVELIGRRWTGAIVAVLLQAEEPMRFSEIAAAVPQLSDRLLSERVKELEARGVVERAVLPGPPIRVEYALTAMGRDLAPALDELAAWARRWLPSAVARD